MNLRKRLVITLTVALSLSFLVFGLAQYEVIHRSLVSEVDKGLAVRGTGLRSGILRYAENGQVTQATLEHFHLNPRPLQEASNIDQFIQISTPTTVVALSSNNLQGKTLPLTRGLAIESYQTIDFDGMTVRLLTVPVRLEGREIATIVLARSLQLVDASLERSVGLMALAGFLTLGLSTLVTVLILSQGLSPLNRVARTAQDIVATGDVSRRVTVAHATDEVGQVAEAFNSVVQRVEELLQQQRRLLADTSHELRNPLTVIRTDLDMLRNNLDAETRTEIVAEAEQEAARMSRLVNELLLLTSTETAQEPEQNFEPVRLDVLTQETVSRMQPLAGTRDFKLDVNGPVLVMGDMDRLRQVLTNLLENAIRFTKPDGHIKIQLELKGDTATLAVQDDGVGIEGEHLAHIFERFYRVDRARSRASGGTGLGLSIAHALVQAHGGTLRAESQPGQGSRFFMTLHAEPMDSPG